MFCVSFLISLLLFCSSLSASEYSNVIDEDELNDDYDDISDELEVFGDSDTNQKPSVLDNLILTLRHQLGYTDGKENQLTTNRSSIRLQWHYNHNNWLVKADAKSSYDFALSGSDYGKSIKEKYQQQNRIRELYIKTTLGSASITLGRQVVIWGKADGAQVTDVISPRNLTESIFIPVEDARLGQTMLVISGYSSSGSTYKSTSGSTYDSSNNSTLRNTQHEWSLIINPDKKPDEIALPGHPYALTPEQSSALLQNINLKEQQPAFSWRSPEVGFRWARTQGKLDTAFMIARVNDNTPALSIDTITPSTLLTQYPRYTMIGAGLNWANGAFVWKGEIAKKLNRTLNCFDLAGCGLSSAKYDFWDSAIGFDYSANGAYTVTVEISNQHLSKWQNDILGYERNRTVAYGSINKNWLNEILTTQYTHFYDLQAGDALHRLLLEYQLSDYWKTTFQIDYFDVHKSGTPLSGLSEKHRVAFSIEANF